MNTLFDTDALPPMNALTEGERMQLVQSAFRTCAKEARAASRACPAHEFEDLEQEALLACVEASRRWSPDAGTKFNTYATSCVRRHLANVTTKHRGEGLIQIESWDTLPAPPANEPLEADEVAPMSVELAALVSRLEGEDCERWPLTEHQQEAVNRLGEPSKSVIALLMVYRLSTEQVAVQLDRPVKDIKLIARNAAKKLPREIVRASAPNLLSS